MEPPLAVIYYNDDPRSAHLARAEVGMSDAEHENDIEGSKPSPPFVKGC